MCYPNGTVNHWEKMERPGVLVENGHVTAMTLAVIDVAKEKEHGNDGHGSKIVVVPFDGVALDRDLQTAAAAARVDRGSHALPVIFFLRGDRAWYDDPLP